MAETRAHLNRRIRQDSLREWLSEKCTAQHLVDNINKIENLNPKHSTFANQLNKYRVANEQRLKILNKYLPDLKQEEFIDGSGVDKQIDQLSDAELQAIANGDK